MQYRIIKLLYMHPKDSLRQIDVEKYYSLTNPTVTGILSNLERDGWVERRPNPLDARSKVLRLTDKAYEHKEILYSIGDRVEADLTASLDEAEHKQLVSLLKKMLNKQVD